MKTTLLRALLSIQKRCPKAELENGYGGMAIDRCIEILKRDLRDARVNQPGRYRLWTGRHYWMTRKENEFRLHNDDRGFGSPMLTFRIPFFSRRYA